MIPMPRLSIIIVSYNARDDLERCLDSLVRSKIRIDHEIVVVDNASTDGSADAVRARWTGVRVIEAGSNLGFARANNLGIRNTFGELILLLNGDTMVAPRAIDALVERLDARPDVAVVGPRLVDGTGRAELSFGKMMTPLAELRQKVIVRGNARGVAPIVAYVDRITRREQEVDWVSGACLLVRRADAEAVGLLDERYFMYTEDIDFCAAIRARNRRILFTPVAEIVHLRGRSAASSPRTADAAYRRSRLAFYEKHLPRWAPLLRRYLQVRARIADTPEDPFSGI
jgi:N-acetylglucosaminyl-diphospho-decaprenol L-rhamnosyltransferase